MIKPSKQNFHIYQGSTFKFEFTVKDDVGVPVDLTGATLQSQIRQYKNSPEVILDLAESDSISIVDAVNGSILINISADDTAMFEIEKSVYDAEVHFANGEVYRILEGGIYTSFEVTRA